MCAFPPGKDDLNSKTSNSSSTKIKFTKIDDMIPIEYQVTELNSTATIDEYVD
jgi:hypothetical protein